METKSITAEIPKEDFERLKEFQKRRCTTWAGLLVIASEKLPEKIDA